MIYEVPDIFFTKPSISDCIEDMAVPKHVHALAKHTKARKGSA
ncbi:MAG: hypothetical protein NVSMB44_46390 [Ktedonobacteraceae bacterium]